MLFRSQWRMLASVLVWSFPAWLGSTELPAPPPWREARSAVLRLEVLDLDGRVLATGSGFLIGPDGPLVTNYHVVEPGARAVAIAVDGRQFEINSVWAQDIPHD